VPMPGAACASHRSPPDAESVPVLLLGGQLAGRVPPRICRLCILGDQQGGRAGTRGGRVAEVSATPDDALGSSTGGTWDVAFRGSRGVCSAGGCGGYPPPPRNRGTASSSWVITRPSGGARGRCPCGHKIKQNKPSGAGIIAARYPAGGRGVRSKGCGKPTLGSWVELHSCL